MEIKVPTLGESITEATVASWLKQEGAYVKQDEPVAELETDKITVEVNAPISGVIEKVLVKAGESVEVGAILGQMKEGEAPTEKEAKATSEKVKTEEAAQTEEQKKASRKPVPTATPSPILSPAAQKIATEKKLDPHDIKGTGKDGRVTKEDVLGLSVSNYAPTAAREKRVKMTRLRQRIAQRLKESQNTAAMLTTFNEVDMSHVMALRARYKEAFEKKHGIKLGFMSFFTKAAIAALQEVPSVNAEIDGDEIIYKNFYNIGIAVGTPSGLVVPVLKEADKSTFAGIEQSILDYALKAREGKLALEDMSGGTFTITNGGVYGSMMSTPILNPPQSGILGLHKIDKRPMVVNDEIVIRPMMYIALTYDHRIIDGKEAVTFLVKIKEYIEDPERLLLEV